MKNVERAKWSKKKIGTTKIRKKYIKQNTQNEYCMLCTKDYVQNIIQCIKYSPWMQAVTNKPKYIRVISANECCK